jgi:hypothetical protein
VPLSNRSFMEHSDLETQKPPAFVQMSGGF